ncbi:CPBP family intramembrane glutamic endopeptidase [Ectobacillus ponti]|uniref:CPBP family intramembrane metalloprotease n=1 Tax=Ectobacillus ponti TaxID=2961894 RepID=A0AA41XBJ7_9BACI|nr:CPBP family intramembrane glutamic endopeptidase [Ectobacillus ponti]MCP8970324.1 CPBP family intramembrane metalloprotease [Ectobacillus ponti]
MKIWLYQRPILFAVLAFIVSRAVGGVLFLSAQLLYPDLDPIADLSWLLPAGFAGVLLFLVYGMGIDNESGFVKTASTREWIIWAPALMLPAFILWSQGIQAMGGMHAGMLAIAALGIAMNEEILFRGLFMRGFMRYGSFPAIFVPAVLFGFIHAGNLLAGGDAVFTILQVIWATAGGIAFAAIRLRTKSLYPCIVIHFIVDFAEYISTGETGIHQASMRLTSMLQLLILFLVFMAYALVLFWKDHSETKNPHMEAAERASL